MSRGSSELFYATEGLAYIDSVNILVPSTWTNVNGTVTSEYFYDDGDIRINTYNPLYMDNPYTFQPGNCYERGKYIHLTPEFIMNLNNTSENFGPLEKVFVHEWSKYRYGVFEEFGYPGDKQYPLFYYEPKESNGNLIGAKENVLNIIPNFCTDESIQGSRM